jgi:BirA family biotin operon repressor/biotin-[acetyl-CoA-carboxylase] ligase
MSVILRPDGGQAFVSRLSVLPILSSVAAAEALEAVSGLTVQLRWPNDLYRDARKLGGVLCESSITGAAPDHAIVGFGINVNQTEGSFPAELTSSSTSMRCLLERSFDRLEVAAHVVARLEQWWDELETTAALERFRELAEGLEGYPVQVRAPDDASFVAKSLGISSDGGLRVELPDGTERILYSDDVILLRPQEESYYAAVETHFVERRGSPLFITPSEWQLVWEWEREGIPLRVVMEGIDRVFERPKTGQKPRKLSYCRQTVEAAYRRFREMALGGVKVSVSEESQDARTHLTAMAERLRRAHIEWKERDQAVAAAIDFCEREMEALVVQLTPESMVAIEAALASGEERLLDTLERSLGDERHQALLRESEASLADYRPRMPEKIYASAVKSAYRRRLRLELGIPTLSLLDR